MNKRKLVISVFILTGTISNCQIYLDSLYSRVEKGKAYFYQMYENVTDSNLVLKTFLMNNMLIKAEHLKYGDTKKRILKLGMAFIMSILKTGVRNI